MGPAKIYTQRIDELSVRVTAGVNRTISVSRNRLSGPVNRLTSLHPVRLAEKARAKVSNLISRLGWSLGARSKTAADKLAALKGKLIAIHPKHAHKLANQKLQALNRQLEAMSYRNVLERGFSVTRQVNGVILKSVKDIQKEMLIETELADGKFKSTVDEKKETPGAKETQ